MEAAASDEAGRRVYQFATEELDYLRRSTIVGQMLTTNFDWTTQKSTQKSAGREGRWL